MWPWPFTRRRLEPQAAYALWAKAYPPHPHNALMSVEQQAVLSLLPDVLGRAVVDAGCGTGRYLRELRARGGNPVGVDLSAAMLARARSVSDRIVRASLCALPLRDRSVDVMVCGLALGDVANLELAVSEMARTLKPGGCVIYSVVHPGGAARGWTRAFDVDGRRMAIDGYWHSVHEHRRACAAVGLRITAWKEPCIDDSPDHPAALIVRAER